MDLTDYHALWGTRGVAELLASAILARLPVMAALISVSFLAKDAAGSFGWAGVVAGAYSVGTAVGGPMWSRLADRQGPRRVVIATGMAWSVAMAALALLPPDLFRLMPAVSAIAGFLVSPVTPTLRAAWPRLVRESQQRAIYALDATAQELLFGIGPMLGALMVTVANPRLGVLIAAIASGASIWWFGLRLPQGVAHGDAGGPRLTAPQLLRHRHRLRLILAFALCVTAFASVSLGIVAFADEHGNRLLAGVLNAVWAAGSIAGGVIAGALPGRRASFVWRRELLVTVGMSLCAIATWSPLTLGIGLVLSGSMLAPTVGALYERLGALTPQSARTEIFGWMSSAAMAGAAGGSAVAGAAIESLGVAYVWVTAAGFSLIAALLLVGVPPHRSGREPAAEATDPRPAGSGT